MSDDEQKLFSFIELKAMTMLAVAKAMVMINSVSGNESPDKLTKMLENEVDKIINIRWNHPDKENK